MRLTSRASRRPSITVVLLLSVATSLAGCFVDRSGLGSPDGSPPPPPDGGPVDAQRVDAGPKDDAGPEDGGPPPDGCSPVTETCDGTDEDCDGTVDEDVAPMDCANACGTAGERACVGGAFGDCDAPAPPAETCDGTDEDCDGTVDEGVTQACMNRCGAAGIETCDTGTFMGCTAPPEPAETCDGTDEDCDGTTDESITRACMNRCGTAGVETCDTGSFVGCTAPPEPAETCDGTDEDCDGSTDEGLTQACSTACGSGTEMCDTGAWVGCTAPPVVAETCDGTDQDCDGHIDEGGVCATCTHGERTDGSGVLHTYQFCATARGAAAAQVACASAGYDLVTIETAGEHTYVQTTAFGIDDRDWWIGLYRSGASGDGFSWISGSTASYRRWGPGAGVGGAEPNDVGGNEDCVMIEDGSTGFEDRTYWADRECNITTYYVCELP